MAMKEAHAGTVLTIDLDAIRDNFRLLRAKASGAACAAVLKADAYGLGAARVAPVLAEEGCRHFFVAHLDEGIALRPHLPSHAEVFVLHGPMPGTEPEFMHHRLVPVLNSAAQVAGMENPMTPVVRLQARVMQVRSIEDGGHVGYGATYRAAGPRRIATVSVGYADGWLRSFSNRGCALAGGVRAPIAGIVSMDTCTLDVTDVDQRHLQPGACVDLISDEQPVDTVAAQAGTIAYEILTSLGNRYYRNYAGGAAHTSGEAAQISLQKS